MSSTPSRSEIETALSGRTKRQANKPRRSAQPNFDLDAPPRRQQVIGGDLTGVTNRPKRGLFSRYSNVSFSYWIAGAIVLLILLAFFWPKGGESTREVVEAEAKIRNELDSSIEPIELDTPISDQNFTRESDIERANDYREQDTQEQQIQELLQAAEALATQGKYTEPVQESALGKYRAIQKIDPKNVAAKQGIDYISGRFLAAGYAALESDKEKLARDSLSRLASISRESAEYQELSLALENWQAAQKVNDLIAQAKTAFAKDALILPARKNALYFYRQALALDETNEQAAAGLQEVADTYIQRANDAVLAGQYQTAAAHLATVTVIDPDHASIDLIEAMMERAKPIVESTQTASEETPTTSTSESGSATPSQPSTNTDSVAANDLEPQTTRPERANTERTPSRQSSEQADFDRQYLKEGLDAYYKGEYDTAAALLQPLADKGVARAQFRLAYMHYLGRGFTQDRREADRRIRAALPAIRKFAAEGRAWAQSDLGSLYEDGLVLPRDFGEAVYWYRSSAEQGYPGAQTNLGFMYARGLGVTASRRTAIQWFQRAAKQGDNVAIRNLEALGVN